MATRNKLGIGLILLAALAIGLLVVALFMVLSPPEEPNLEVSVGEPSVEGASSSEQRTSERAEDTPPASVESPPAAKARRFQNPEARDALLRALEAARTKREGAHPAPTGASGGSGGSGPAEEEAPRGHLSKEYIREVVHEAVPLIRECYDMALEERTEDQPNLSGRLIARFTIAGEDEVGGLVEEVDVESDEGLSVSETLTECVRETVYSMEFEPPEGGGSVVVAYPFVFTQTEGDDEGSGE